MPKRQASLLSFCQSPTKRQRESEEKADDQAQGSDSQDVQVEENPEKSEQVYTSVIIHHMITTLSLSIFMWHLSL